MVSGGNIARSRIENMFLQPKKFQNPEFKQYDKISKFLFTNDYND